MRLKRSTRRFWRLILPPPRTRTSILPTRFSGCRKKARWSHLKANAKQPTIGTLIDDAMRAIEDENPSLKGVLPKDYARPALNKVMLGELTTDWPSVAKPGRSGPSVRWAREPVHP